MATRRYKRLDQDDFYAAFNKVRDAFLAAKDGNEVNEVINALLTDDEKTKIGRRVLIADFLREGVAYREIADILKVSNNTILKIADLLENRAAGFDTVLKRSQKVKDEYKAKAYRRVGPSRVAYKRKEYTGFKRSDVKR